MVFVNLDDPNGDEEYWFRAEKPESITLPIKNKFQRKRAGICLILVISGTALSELCDRFLLLSACISNQLSLELTCLLVGPKDMNCTQRTPNDPLSLVLVDNQHSLRGIKIRTCNSQKCVGAGCVTQSNPPMQLTTLSFRRLPLDSPTNNARAPLMKLKFQYMLASWMAVTWTVQSMYNTTTRICWHLTTVRELFCFALVLMLGTVVSASKITDMLMHMCRHINRRSVHCLR